MFSIFSWIETLTCSEHWYGSPHGRPSHVQFSSGGAGSKTSASRVSWSSHSAELAESLVATDAGGLR